MTILPISLLALGATIALNAERRCEHDLARAYYCLARKRRREYRRVQIPVKRSWPADCPPRRGRFDFQTLV